MAALDSSCGPVGYTNILHELGIDTGDNLSSYILRSSTRRATKAHRKSSEVVKKYRKTEIS